MSELPATLGELAAFLKGRTRADFLAEHPYPFLLRRNDAGAQGENLAHTTAFNTMALNPERIRARARELLKLPIFALRKRAGGNAFGLMVTVGRAGNNDIVFPDQQVSKFHASFLRNPQGQWTITDASSNGTWLDGEKLANRAAHALRVDATIDLAHAVVLTFLPPDRVFAEIEAVWRRGS